MPNRGAIQQLVFNAVVVAIVGSLGVFVSRSLADVSSIKLDVALLKQHQAEGDGILAELRRKVDQLGLPVQVERRKQDVPQCIFDFAFGDKTMRDQLRVPRDGTVRITGQLHLPDDAQNVAVFAGVRGSDDIWYIQGSIITGGTGGRFVDVPVQVGEPNKPETVRGSVIHVLYAPQHAPTPGTQYRDGALPSYIRSACTIATVPSSDTE